MITTSRHCAVGGGAVVLFLGLMCTPTLVCALTPGLDLAWDDCGSPGTSNVRFACDSNLGSRRLVASFVLSGSASAVYVAGGVLQFQFSGGSLPTWWQIHGVGACRDSSIAVGVSHAGLSDCADTWQDQATGVIGNYFSFQPDTYRLTFAAAIPPALAPDMAPGVEYFLASFVLDYRGTVGQGACSGCSLGADVTFISLYLDQVTLGRIVVTAPGDHANVTWQDGLVPTKRTSWSAIKALYR